MGRRTRRSKRDRQYPPSPSNPPPSTDATLSSDDNNDKNVNIFPQAQAKQWSSSSTLEAAAVAVLSEGVSLIQEERQQEQQQEEEHPPSSSAASPIPAVEVSIIDNRQEIALKSATTNNNIPIPPKLPIEVIKHIVGYVHEDTLPNFITVDLNLWNNETNERLNRRLVELTRRLQVSETLLCENRQRILHAMENMEDEEDI